VAVLSVIVPAYGVQAYIRECIQSVLDQGFDDVEILGVDDCSPDHSGAILDELAALDARVRVIHLEQNAGLGGARNAGVAAATGRYVLFLDGDDTLAPGSLHAIADRLDYGDDPQLLIYNYARVWWDGRRAVSWADEVLASLSASVFVPREHPPLFNLLPIACNKVYRRDFLEQIGVSFPPGYYEDIAFTYTVLLEAETAVSLNRVVLLYRQRRGGSILGSASPKHFDVFGRYSEVFAELDRRDVELPLRKHLYDIMINHYVTILRHPERLASADKPRFYVQAREAARAHARDWSSVPKQNAASNLRARLLLDRSYRWFTVYNRVDALRRSLRKGLGRVYWPTRRAVRRLRAVGRMYYPFARMRAIDPNLVVFSEYWGTGYGCNPRALFERLPDVAPHLRSVWVISPEKAKFLPLGTPHVSPDSWRRYAVFARAKYFVNNVNFPGPVVKRPGQVHIQTMHGTPLKHCGLDVLRSSVASTAVDPVRQPRRSEGRVVATDEAQSLREFENLLRRSDRWDVALSSNAYSSEMWSHAYPCRYRWLEFGYPRNDALVNATPEDFAQARQLLGVPEGATAILYAPTFREAVGDTSMRIDIAGLIERLPSDTVVIVRAHHTATAGRQMAGLFESGRVIDGSKVPWIVPCYLAADVLLTDYSSVMFDYALLNRPIVIYADDWNSYLENRGAYFDLLAAPPGPVARNPRELADILVERSYLGDESTALRAAFRERFCSYDDGHAAERVIRSVMLPPTG
jgi:CDP-glycerol glycerophosphotransferase (TagB/SpsB family)/glycosyltransferase involved in cell wall biosynthesis